MPNNQIFENHHKSFIPSDSYAHSPQFENCQQIASQAHPHYNATNYAKTHPNNQNPTPNNPRYHNDGHSDSESIYDSESDLSDYEYHVEPTPAQHQCSSTVQQQNTPSPANNNPSLECVRFSSSSVSEFKTAELIIEEKTMRRVRFPLVIPSL
jgi:hypothetical protein